MIKVGSDFSGVGAFNQALIRLGIEYKELFACDMDKYARQTFIHNYGEPEYYPTNVYDREIPSESLDIYMTSPPCQAFSLAGKRLGKDDKRGILFFNSYEFIEKNKPRYFIFENVNLWSINFYISYSILSGDLYINILCVNVYIQILFWSPWLFHYASFVVTIPFASRCTTLTDAGCAIFHAVLLAWLSLDFSMRDTLTELFWLPPST